MVTGLFCYVYFLSARFWQCLDRIWIITKDKDERCDWWLAKMLFEWKRRILTIIQAWTLFVTPESDNLSVSTKSYQMSDVIVKRFVYYSEIIVIRLNNVMIRIYLSELNLFLFACICVLVTALVIRGSVWLWRYAADSRPPHTSHSAGSFGCRR